MAFDKELAILGGFFNLRISKKNYRSRKKPQWGRKHFFLKKNVLFDFISKCIQFYMQNCQILCFKSI